jgi:hypothetical protein
MFQKFGVQAISKYCYEFLKSFGTGPVAGFSHLSRFTIPHPFPAEAFLNTPTQTQELHQPLHLDHVHADNM